MRTVVLLGNFGATNIGDEALLESMLHLFSLEKNTHVHVLSARPDDTMHRYGASYHITSSHLFPVGFRSLITLPQCIRSLWKLRSEATDVYFGGGGLFTDHSSLYAVFYWWVQFWFVRLVLKKPVHIIGQSFGPLERPLARLLTTQVLTRVASVSVRDDSSAVLVKELAPMCTPTVLPDLAFSYPLPTHAKTARKPLRIALSLRPWKDTHHWEQVILSTLGSLAKSTPIDVVLVPMQSIKEEDLSILEGMQRRLSALPNITVRMEHLHSFAEVAKLLSTCTLSIGQRLHFLICSLRSGTPCVALSYSNKVAAIMNEADMPVLFEPEEASLTSAVESITQDCKTFEKRAKEFASQKTKESEPLKTMVAL
ncbi:hypothetical protein COW46_01800 [Candidatus Gracilibacteria bacterium CG17_big_fil_post_rev_8_21_14_2_50_48_13]|nr:MAG: hypothetical protein COW46_01800 [Candidatus Gracilibacteria bacterium CG17_big_fil_post_rev_8_21_14_2_50_48_13]